MERPAHLVWISAAVAAACVALAAGCGPASAESREARDRHLRRALEAKESQDIDRAIELCQKAIGRRPNLALAHRELGLMLDNYRQDYASALYHYRRYLELRPDAKNRAAVEELIRHCRISFAAEIEESPDELKRDLQSRNERIAALELEVVALREQPGASSRPVLAPAAEPRPPAAGTAQVHVVQAGENLGAISTRYYGTPAKWKTIFNANRDRVPDANNLRVGTRLDIPQQ